MMPFDHKLGFGDVCNFVVCCVENGLTVTCFAIERPDVRMSNVRSLAGSLGAPIFTTYPYHP
jgi:hypothetical protein